MPSTKNVNEVASLKDKFAKAKSVVFADYRGLSVSQITKLRNKIKELGGELKVSKNTLVKLALGEQAEKDAVKECLEGPTAAVFSYEDEFTPLKTVWEFQKENEIPQIKAGFLGNEFLSLEKITQLAQLPTSNELKAKIIGMLNAPLYGLVNSLKGNLTKLVLILKQIQNQPALKEASAE